MDRKEIKAKARELAKTNKWNVWKPLLVIFGISFGIGLIAGILAVIVNNQNVISIISDVTAIATIPATFGYIAYLLKIVRGEEFNLELLKKYYPMFIRLLILTLLVGVFTFLWSLLFIIPGIIAALSYSMIYYIAVDNEELEAMDVIKKSKEMMNGHKWEFFVFQLSFIGWDILAGFTCGILYIWLFPYQTLATTIFYDELKKLN